MSPSQSRIRTIAPLGGERKTSPTFITLTGESEDELQAKIEQMNQRGFTRIGAIVSTKGVRTIPGPAQYVCLMSGYPETDMTKIVQLPPGFFPASVASPIECRA